MRIQGEQLTEMGTVEFALPRASGAALTLTLAPLPLGFHRQLHIKGIVPPTAPTKVARDSAGKPVRQNDGQALLIPDTTDADYLAEHELYHQRVAVLSIATALRADSLVAFDATPPLVTATASNEWQLYADALFEELEAAHFTAGDLVLLCREVCRISNLLDQHVRAAQSTFS